MNWLVNPLWLTLVPNSGKRNIYNLGCRANMLDEDNLKHVGIDKEDILFSWIKKIDERAMKIQICTISFPSYHYLRLGVLNRRQKGKEMADNLKGTYVID